MTQPEDLLENLNPPQREAVLTTEGPTLIIAGPGSGKTRVITHRIAHLTRNLGVDPRSILAMTFTNKAANEMAQRAAKLAGEYERNARVSTFHSFCARTLRNHGEPVGLKRNYLIYDEDDQIAAIRECIEQHGWTKYNPRDLQTQISHAKSNLMGPDDMQPTVRQWESELLLSVYRTYEGMLRRNNAVDFDDLILLTVRLFRESPPVLRQYQETYRYLMVDEFQDTNPAQYEMAKLLTTAGRNFCAVGDPDQAIYSWRNADVRNIRSFQADHPEVRTITLGQNYRSTSNIVEVSKRLIEWNHRPVQNELFTENPSGDPVAAVNYDDERQETRAIVKEVDRLTSQEGYKLQECAVLYRTNACSQLIEEACLDQGMRYRIVGGIQFYRRKEIKSLTAYLKLIYNENDNVNLLRVINTPSRGLGRKSIEQLAGWAALQEVPVYTAITRLAQGETPPPGISRKALNSIRDFAQTVETLKEADWHVRMQGAVQSHTDNSVSKTINFPHHATVDDMTRAYMLAYELGCKGITVYRDGSKAGQVLSTGEAEKETAGPAAHAIPRARPRRIRGITERVRTGHGNMYVTINFDEDEGPFEVFGNLGKAGGCDSAQLEAISRLASLALRSGIDPEVVIEQLRGITCCPAWDEGTRVGSSPDAVALALQSSLGKQSGDGATPGRRLHDPGSGVQMDLLSRAAPNPTRKCPDCNSPVYSQEGCLMCVSCGWNRCE